MKMTLNQLLVELDGCVPFQPHEAVVGGSCYVLGMLCAGGKSSKEGIWITGWGRPVYSRSNGQDNDLYRLW